VKPSVWFLGNLTIDDVVLPDGSTAMGLCGGNAIYAALGARLWQRRVGLAARIGPDYPMAEIARVRAAGIQLELVAVSHPSIHNWALYESVSTRRFINWIGAGSHYDQSIRADELPTDVHGARACHLAPMPLSVQASLVDALVERGVPIIALDPHEDYIGGHEEQLRRLLPSVTVFLPSRVEAQRLFGRDDPEAAIVEFAAAGPAVVAIKLGGDGSLVAIPGTLPSHVPAVAIEAIDTTGCGDAYSGGFVAAYVRGVEPVLAACHGTVSASFTAETRGAPAVLPFDLATARARLDALRELVAPLQAPGTVDRQVGKGASYAHG
jgi:ribokinase